MGAGAIIVGLNGCGKTTLGGALASQLGAFPMDVETYYFPPTDALPFSVSRSEEEVRALMLADMDAYPRFVLSSVNGEWCDGIASRLRCAVFLTAPAEVRLERIDRREALRFGDRVRPGGDMYEQQCAFHAMVARRTEAPIEAWLAAVCLPVLRLDACRAIEENTALAARFCREQGL